MTRRPMRRFSTLALILTAALAGCASGGGSEVESAPVTMVPTDVTAHVRDVPIPDFYRRPLAAGTRSPTGEPGPAYWQNRVSYRIDAELDPETATLTGSERIVYYNDSPTTLPSIVLNLSQNIYSQGVPRNRYVPVTGGFTISRVAAQGQDLSPRSGNQIPIGGDVPNASPGFSVQGTLGRVRLPRPLASGDSVVLEIEWNHEIPPATSFRTGWEDAFGSRAFQVAQWYPQVATYDDLHGWAVTPYLGDGEFYLEYGDFEVSITVPAGYLVGATGQLLNPSDVLTDEARERLDRAADADSITHIVTQADLSAENATQSAPGGQLTWRFSAHDVRDFAFATSAGYVWDATRAPTTESAAAGSAARSTIMVHALYRPDAPNWSDAATYGQHSIALFDREITPYIYQQITITEGPIGGMEYPMLVFIGKPGSGRALHGVIAHEIAHEWFPMMVGQDEAAYAWMDEGMATYFEDIATGDFFDDENPFASDLASYLRVAGSDVEVPVMRHADLITPYGARGVAAYSKPGVLFRALRTILGEDRFYATLADYASSWLLKHPTPWDFFSTFERAAGRELDWFFYPWWFETGVLDQAITSVTGAESGTAVVTVESRGEIPAPATIMATTAEGETVTAEIPVETWLGASEATITITAPGPIRLLAIDPNQIFPDVDLGNNVWQAALTP